MNKNCTCCKAQKSINEFYKNAKKKDGLQPNCKECAKKSSNAWKVKNVEKSNAITLRSREKDRNAYLKKAKDRAVTWRLNNPGYSNRYQTARKQIDSNFKLISQIRNLILICFKSKGYKKNTKTEQLLGCSFNEFKNHIEKQFLDGMSWDNRGQWHIDHITPMRIAKTKEEIVALNHYTNLRPLWASDNLTKNGAVHYLI